MLPALEGAVHVTLTLELVGSKAVTPIGTEGTGEESHCDGTVMKRECEQPTISTEHRRHHCSPDIADNAPIASTLHSSHCQCVAVLSSHCIYHCPSEHMVTVIGNIDSISCPGDAGSRASGGGAGQRELHWRAGHQSKLDSISNLIQCTCRRGDRYIINTLLTADLHAITITIPSVRIVVAHTVLSD